jgi:hypothetical protein
MANLSSDWDTKLAAVGWRPENMQLIAREYLGEYASEHIRGVITTGDGIGDLLGVSLSRVRDSKRIEKTLVGFTVGDDNSTVQRSVVPPENRIPGCLFIAADKFIACGVEKHEFSFSEILVALGSGRTVTAANYDLQRMGVRNYSYGGDIYAAKFELNRQENLNCGYDLLIIAFAANGKAIVGTDIGGLTAVWRQLERTIIAGED